MAFALLIVLYSIAMGFMVFLVEGQLLHFKRYQRSRKSAMWIGSISNLLLQTFFSKGGSY